VARPQPLHITYSLGRSCDLASKCCR